MHIIERYSLAVGAKIDKPSINTKFFPLPFEKYVTFNAASVNMPAKSFQLWQEVINIISPELDKNGIKIVQLGAPEEPQYMGVVRYNGQTSIQQSAYIIKHSILHIGIDSFLSHVASIFDIPLVALFSVSPPDTCGPYFGDKSKQICLEPEFKENEGYYFASAGPALANTIKIEKIVSAIEIFLNKTTDVVYNFAKIKTLFVGSQYCAPVIEVLCDSSQIPNFSPETIPMLRLDLSTAPNKEDIAYAITNIRKCGIFTAAPLRIDVLTQLKKNTDKIIYLIGKDYSIEFIKSMYYAGLQFILLTDLPESETGEMKLDISEYGILHQRPKGARPPNLEIGKNTYFKTNRLLFGGDKIYLSVEHFRQNMPQTDGTNIGKPIQNDGFWADNGDFTMIYDRIS